MQRESNRVIRELWNLVKSALDDISPNHEKEEDKNYDETYGQNENVENLENQEHGEYTEGNQENEENVENNENNEEQVDNNEENNEEQVDNNEENNENNIEEEQPPQGGEEDNPE